MIINTCSSWDVTVMNSLYVVSFFITDVIVFISCVAGYVNSDFQLVNGFICIMSNRNL